MHIGRDKVVVDFLAGALVVPRGVFRSCLLGQPPSDFRTAALGRVDVVSATMTLVSVRVNDDVSSKVSQHVFGEVRLVDASTSGPTVLSFPIPLYLDKPLSNL